MTDLEKLKEEMKERENEAEDVSGVAEAEEPKADPVAEETAEAPKEDTNADTVTASPEESKGEAEVDESVNAEEKPAEKMLTQSQVNELMGKAREEGRRSAMKDLFVRYGVNDDAELDNVFGKGQAYDDLNDEFLGQGNSYRDAMAENALLKAHIDESRWEDVKLILGGKGLEVSSENIEAMLPSHPEWRPQEVGQNPMNMGTPQLGEAEFEQLAKNAMKKPVASEEPAKLRKLGNEITTPAPQETDEEKAKKLFGL